MAAGVRFVVTHRVLGTLTGAWGLYWLAFWLFWGQYPLYATRELGLTPTALGVVGSLAAGAGVLGAVVTAPLTARFGAGGTMTGALLGAAAGTLLFAAAGGAPAVAGAVLALGLGLVLFCDPPYLVNYTSAFQALAPDGLRGRVGASIRVLTAGTVPVGAFLGGFLAEAVGLRATAVVAGLGVVAAFLWLALSPVRSLRSLSGDSGESEVTPTPSEPPGTTPAGDAAPRQPVAGRV
jgi:predicted MFS family arabinose efflux permease